MVHICAGMPRPPPLGMPWFVMSRQTFRGLLLDGSCESECSENILEVVSVVSVVSARKVRQSHGGGRRVEYLQNELLVVVGRWSLDEDVGGMGRKRRRPRMVFTEVPDPSSRENSRPNSHGKHDSGAVMCWLCGQRMRTTSVSGCKLGENVISIDRSPCTNPQCSHQARGCEYLSQPR